MKKIIEKDKQFIAGTYNRQNKIFVKGKGSKLYDEQNNEYLDFSAGIAVNTFGSCDNEFQKAVKKQLSKLQHISNIYYTEPQILLSELICKKTGAKKVFFSNSGAEANECAIKACRKYSFDKYGNDRYEIITLKNSFHGRTMATLTATGQDDYHKYFNPFLKGFSYVEANNIAEMKKAVTSHTAGIMLETIQGEGGILVLNDDFIKAVAVIAKENDILLIIDEVQTGNGRTGKLYSYMNYNLQPDIITTAKGLGGGLPIGATMFFEKTENVLTFGSHGSTFGGNPVICSGAYSILSRIDDDLLKSVTEKGNYIMEKLTSYGAKTFGKGLMIGFTVDNKDNKTIQKECLDNKLVVLTAHDKVRLLPPLNVSYKEIDSALLIIKECINN
ncbi:MAG: aspartate aminotransferase family protein [Clostridia bacterium]